MATLRDLTISVVDHGHGLLLDHLLDDLSAAGALGQSRVIVTMNIPDADFPKGKWAGRSIEWIHNAQPKGFGANHNNALLTARTPWVLVLNPDIRLEATLLVRLLDRAAGRPDVGIVAPRILSTEGTPEDSVRTNLSPGRLLLRSVRRMLALQARAIIHPDQADWLAGMFFLIPTDVYLAVRGFDERFFLYCEDYDLCARVSLNGQRLVLDDSCAVIHSARRASHRQMKYLFWHLRSLTKVWTSAAFWKYSFARAIRRVPGVLRAREPDPGQALID